VSQDNPNLKDSRRLPGDTWLLAAAFGSKIDLRVVTEKLNHEIECRNAMPPL
jgi:hypothetical protein